MWLRNCFVLFCEFLELENEKNKLYVEASDCFDLKEKVHYFIGPVPLGCSEQSISAEHYFQWIMVV